MESKNLVEIHYTNKVPKDTLFELLLGLMSLMTSGWMIYLSSKSEFTFPLAFIIITLLFIGVHPFILYLNYYKYGRGMEIIIQPEKNQITVIRDGKRNLFKIENIEFVETYKSATLPRYGLSFSYVKYYLKSKETIIVTSLMTNNLFIPKTSPEPIISESFFPLINRNPIVKNSKEDNYNKLLKKYQKYSTTKLQEIVESKHYHYTAKKVANKVLEKRITKHNSG